jgi:hypothetical protein
VPLRQRSPSAAFQRRAGKALKDFLKGVRLEEKKA